MIERDITEGIRRRAVTNINASVESDNEQKERARLESVYGKVWNTDEIQKEFEVTGFLAPFVVVTRKSDNVEGTLMFQHSPRFYFSFQRK